MDDERGGVKGPQGVPIKVPQLATTVASVPVPLVDSVVPVPAVASVTVPTVPAVPILSLPFLGSYVPSPPPVPSAPQLPSPFGPG